jgi:hypothetical protein
MVRLPVLGPHGHSDQVIKGGKTTAGQPRSKGQNPACPHERVQRALLSPGRAPALKEPIVDMRRHGRGLRETARVVKRWPQAL